jgi:hypothetical protein
MKGLARPYGQVRRLKIIPGREYGFTMECRQRIDRAIAEVELRSVPLALSKASESGDRRLRLGDERTDSGVGHSHAHFLAGLSPTHDFIIRRPPSQSPIPNP